VRANFTGKVTLTDLNPPAGYTISGEGQGGVAGFAKGSAKVALEEEGGETVLRYGVQAQVGGKLAQIGSRLIDGAAAKVADDFFARLVERLTPPGAVAPQAVAVSEAAARWRRMWLRLAIAAAIIVVMAVYWLTRAA
jgi:hypothetical protein